MILELMGNFGSRSGPETSRPARGSSSAPTRQQQAQQTGVLSLRGFNITKVILPQRIAVNVLHFLNPVARK